MSEKPILIAFCTDNGEEYSKEHFGSAAEYLIYGYDANKKNLNYVKTIKNGSVEEDEEAEEEFHGDPDKAKSVSEVMKGVSILCAKVMGLNIKRMRKKFVAVISREMNIIKSQALLLPQMDEIIAETAKHAGEERKIFFLKVI